MRHVCGLERARVALERGDRFPAGTLPRAVAQSWQRCRALGLDPQAAPERPIVPFAEVRRRREAVAAMRRLALAEMGLLHSQIAGSSFMIALGDADGMVLDTISDQRFSESAAGREIVPGSVWQEGQRGTNALGLAALERQPVAIHGREHYFASHGQLSCMAAPILDPRGQLLGLLDASCANDARQQHTLVLVRMAAAQIENGLIFQEHAGSFILAFHPRADYLGTLSAGLIAVTRDGEVQSLNRPATSLLAGLPAVAGAGFAALFEASFSTAMDGLLQGGVTRIRDRAGSGLFMVCRQIGQQEARPRPALAGAAPPRGGPPFVCAHEPLVRLIEQIPRAVAMRMPVLITGETGTGKELMARHVHEVSGRAGAFVALNCGAVPEALLAAELFGHERGAFTGARADGAPGLARAADHGTLFLDEVAEIPLAAQAALLRFLDGMEVRPAGGSQPVRVDVQVIAATNRDLAAMVAARAFRGDLLYRLNPFTIELPPLAARTDFALIVQHLMRRIAPDVSITDAAIARLGRRAWPGNIRELKAELQRALIRRRAAFLDEDAFDWPAADAEDCCDACRPALLDRQRCQEIRAAFHLCGKNVTLTARRLGLSRTTIYRHLR